MRVCRLSGTETDKVDIALTEPERNSTQYYHCMPYFWCTSHCCVLNRQSLLSSSRQLWEASFAG